MRQGVKLRIQEKSERSGWRSTGAGVKAHGPVTRKEHGRPQHMRMGVLAPGVEVEQLPGDRHPRERNRSLGVDEEGSQGKRPTPFGTAPITFRAAKAPADGDRTGGGLASPCNHEGSPFPTPEGYMDCYSHRDPRTQCSSWPT